MKKLFATLSMIVGFITVVSAQNIAKPAEALTAKPVTKETPVSDIKSEKKKTTDVTPVEVKVATLPDEASAFTTDQGTKSKVETMPVKVTAVEKPVTNSVKIVKVVPVEKAVEVKPAKTKN